jgi:hypothetical protein
MSKEIEPIAAALFDKVRSRFSPLTLGNENAKQTDDPSKARFFNFKYTDSAGNSHGQILISLIDEQTLKVSYGQDIVGNMEKEQRTEWYDFLRNLRMFAKRNLLKFDASDLTRGGLKIGDIKQQAKVDDVSTTDDVTVTESRMYGTPGRPRESVGEHGGIRIRVKHSEPVLDEVRGARARKIESIFLETPQGERFLCGHKNLSAARALAEHLCNGGTPYDEIAEAISSMVSEMNAMKHFVRSTKNRQFEDRETSDMAHAAIKHYYHLKDTLKHLSQKKYYDEFVEDFIQPTSLEDEIDVDALKERFVKKVYDERFDEALPIVYREYKRQQNNLANELDEWANQILEDSGENDITDEENKLRALQELCKTPLLAGINGIDAKTDLEPIVNNLPGADKLLDDITTLADPVKGRGSDADARILVKAWANQHMPDWASQLQFGSQNVDDATTNWTPQTSPEQADPKDQYGAANASIDEPLEFPTTARESIEDPLDFIRFLSGLKK